MPTAGRLREASASLAGARPASAQSATARSRRSPQGEGGRAKAGYSGTPLPQKLGIREGHRVALDRAPSGFEATLGPLLEGVRLLTASEGRDFDVILLFVKDLKTLEARLEPAIQRMAPSTALWICWPKKTSPLATDVDETKVRERGLAAGIVDIKVCAVDEDWSGHKFVFRLKDRPALEKKKASKKK
jgi:hypothetical protein